MRRLCVVDIAPVDYGGSGEFAGYVEAMQALDLGSLERRADADAALESAVPNRTVRDFLLQNLRHEGDGWRWQVNLEVLGRDLDALSGWPADRLEGLAPFEGPVALGGGRGLGLRAQRAGSRDASPVPAHPQGRRQGRRSLGARPAT